MELESKEGGDKEVIGGALGTPPSLRLLFSALQKQRCSAEDKQRRVPHQEGKQGGDIFDQLKGHIQTRLGAIALEPLTCLYSRFTSPVSRTSLELSVTVNVNPPNQKEVPLSAAALKPRRL